jgi:fatty acid desaturase
LTKFIERASSAICYNRSMRATRVEWPTVAVAVAIYAGFAAVLLWHEALPTVVVVPALAVLGAWYNSLQHEVVHGHPTPWRAVNHAFAAIPLGLVVPFGVYRDTHRAHHLADPLTDPDIDPESFYVSAATWARYGPLRRAAARTMQTLAGRLILGPPVGAVRWWRRIVALGSPADILGIVGHLAAAALVLIVVHAAGLPLWVYVLGVVWAGGALSLLRSFAEHRPQDDATPSAVVRAGWFFSLLFLNNNLHHTHHARPGVAWYELPQVHTELDADRAAAAGAGWYHGYGEVARRYLISPFDEPYVIAR